MTHKALPHPDQLALEWEKDPTIEALIEARVAKRAEAAAFQWRLRLVAIETCMMGCLVIAAGMAANGGERQESTEEEKAWSTGHGVC